MFVFRDITTPQYATKSDKSSFSLEICPVILLRKLSFGKCFPLGVTFSDVVKTNWLHLYSVPTLILIFYSIILPCFIYQIFPFLFPPLNFSLLLRPHLCLCLPFILFPMTSNSSTKSARPRFIGRTTLSMQFLSGG